MKFTPQFLFQTVDPPTGNAPPVVVPPVVPTVVVPPAQPVQTAAPQAQPQPFEAILAAANNNSGALAQQLYRDKTERERENFDLREERRRLTEEITGLKAQVPEGAIVLTGDEAQSYQAFKSAGLTPQAALDAVRANTLRDVAEVMDYNLETLKFSGADLRYEIREEKDADGQDVRKAYVVTKAPGANGEAAEAVALDVYAAENWKPVLDSLSKTAAQPEAASGTLYPRQTAGNGRTSSGDPVADFLKAQDTARAANPNPLRAPVVMAPPVAATR